MELIKKLFLFPVKVLELLEADLIVPLSFLTELLLDGNIFLKSFQLAFNLVVFYLLFFLLLNFPGGSLKRLNNLTVSLLLVLLLLLSVYVFKVRIIYIFLQLTNNIHVSVSDVHVVLSNFLVLIFVLGAQVLDSLVLLILDFHNLKFSPLLHVITQQLHFEFVLLLDFF